MFTFHVNAIKCEYGSILVRYTVCSLLSLLRKSDTTFG